MTMLILVAILKHTSIYNIQESHNHPHCVYSLLAPVLGSLSNRPRYLKAYGEVIWFGGRVTGLTFVSFIFMVSFMRYMSPT
jgi:hypothetical protein